MTPLGSRLTLLRSSIPKSCPPVFLRTNRRRLKLSNRRSGPNPLNIRSLTYPHTSHLCLHAGHSSSPDWTFFSNLGPQCRQVSSYRWRSSALAPRIEPRFRSERLETLVSSRTTFACEASNIEALTRPPIFPGTQFHIPQKSLVSRTFSGGGCLCNSIQFNPIRALSQPLFHPSSFSSFHLGIKSDNSPCGNGKLTPAPPPPFFSFGNGRIRGGEALVLLWLWAAKLLRSGRGGCRLLVRVDKRKARAKARS